MNYAWTEYVFNCEQDHIQFIFILDFILDF